MIQTGELSNPEYQENTPDRCYFCKTELFVEVEKLAARLGVAVVADGSNRDDHGEHRPGLRAAGERQVRSPLAECGLTKAEIRELAAFWELPTWNKPATPCLSSRIAYGEPVTPERLAMIDQAEAFLRGRGFQPLRVRYHKGDMARIEVAPEALAKFADAEFRRQVVEKLKSLGFQLRVARPGRISQRQPQRRAAAGEPADCRRRKLERLTASDGALVEPNPRRSRFAARSAHQRRSRRHQQPGPDGDPQPDRAAGFCGAGDRRPSARRSTGGVESRGRLAASRSSMGMTNSEAGPLGLQRLGHGQVLGLADLAADLGIGKIARPGLQRDRRRPFDGRPARGRPWCRSVDES